MRRAEVFIVSGFMKLTETAYCGSSAGANPETDTRWPRRYPPLPRRTSAVPVFAATRYPGIVPLVGERTLG